MKYLLAAATLASLAQTRPAEACSPAQTCGDSFCTGTTTLVDASVISIDRNAYTITLQIEAVYGDAADVVAGTTRTLTLNGYADPTDVGQRYLFQASRADATLLIEYRHGLDDPYLVECFGPDATAATVAATMLSPSCYDTLVPDPPPNPSCPDGIVCDAGGATGAPWLVAAAGLVLRRRRARDAGHRRPRG